MNKSFRIVVSIIFVIVITIGALTLLNIRKGKEMAKVNQEAYIVQDQQSMVSRDEFQAMNDEVSKCIVLNDDGTIGLLENIPSDVYEKYKLEYLEDQFEGLNQRVKNGEIKINEDFSIVEVGGN